MITFVKCLVLISGAVLVLASFSFSRSAKFTKIVDYPKDYRYWVHIKSEVIGPESPAFKQAGGIHHIYANPLAMKGFDTGRFPDGSVFVFDVLETVTKDGLITEGSRRYIDVMQKDDQRFANTGGWGFDEFRGDSHTERTLDEKAKIGCFTCHAGQKEHDFVFSSFRK